MSKKCIYTPAAIKKDFRLHRAKEKELKKRRNCGIIEA